VSFYRNQSQMARCQAAYDNQLPSGYDDPEYEEDCEDGECGECKPCCRKASESYEEDRAEALYEQRKERERGEW